jgi:hypothetical protein
MVLVLQGLSRLKKGLDLIHGLFDPAMERETKGKGPRGDVKGTIGEEQETKGLVSLSCIMP